MRPVDPRLVRSAAQPFELELPEALAEEIAEVWAEVEQLDSPSLESAYEHFTAGLSVIPHAWSQHHIALPEGTTLAPQQLLRLALLALGELGLERRSDEGRVGTQPWFRAYQLLADATRKRESLAALSAPLRWLIVDAVLDICELDSRGNAMQEATGWVSACWGLDREAELEPMLRRLWMLAARGLRSDGYDDGSFALTFAGVADHIREPAFAAQLRLVHAWLDHASHPSAPHERQQLQAALREAIERDLDIEQLRALCVPILGDCFTGELPLDPEHVSDDG